MQSYAQTDIGRVRTHNQDYLYSSSGPVGALQNLFVVADGMGGHKAGDYASRFVVEQLLSYVERMESALVIPMLEAGIKDINRRLYARSMNSEELSGMGTTLVAATIEDKTLYVANVGDSRLYLLRDGQITQITRDHSYVEELVALGKMVRGSQDYLKKKNIITRAIGADEQVSVDFFEVELKKGDYILLCSDGLSNMLEEREMKEIIYAEGTLKEKTERLVDAANEHGGRDNIAVVLVSPQISEVNLC